ncbi:MAG: V-type ATP synthase subunit E family protein [Candidatus Woesearchaeota archaeon]|jgi:V/A-type H+-transporting ATPase subunit E
MGLEQVKHEIIEHAEREATKIVSHAKEQAKKDIENAHTVIDAFDTEIQAQLQKEFDQLERKYHAGMKLLSKKILLQKRKEILQAIFQNLQITLSTLPKSEKSKILVGLFTKAKKQCIVGTVYCAQQDVALVKSFTNVVCEKPILGGIIVESKDGDFLIDYSFDSMLSQLQEQKLQEVSAELFGE